MQRPYQRNFITLTQHRGAYTEKGRLALGSCIIELHGDTGKISASAQYLKPAYEYSLCLVAADEENTRSRCLKIAALSAGSGHKMESRFSFNAADVLETGLAIEAFYAVAVVTAVPGGKDVVVLEGVLDESKLPATDNPWQNNLTFFDSTGELKTTAPVRQSQENPSVKEGALVMLEDAVENFMEDKIMKTTTEKDVSAFHPVFFKPAPEDQEKNPPEPEPRSAGKDFFSFFDTDNAGSPFSKLFGAAQSGQNDESHASDYHAAFKAMAKKFNEELDELNAYALLSDDDFDALVGNAAKKQAPTFHAAETDAGLSEIDYILKYNLKTQPFGDRERETVWVTVSLEELPALPFYTVSHMNHPFLLSAFYEHRHFLLGKNQDNANEYLFGVPANYAHADQKIAAALHLNRFAPCNEQSQGEGGFGYWLMTII